MPFQQIVAGLDLELHSHAVIDFATAFAARIGARVTFVHAEPDLPHMSAAEAIEYANAVARSNEERHRRTIVAASRWSTGYDEVILSTGPAAAALQDEAVKRGADLIVIGSGARGVAPDLGRTAQRMLRSLTIPTLVVPTHRPDDGEDAATPTPAGDAPLPEFRGTKLIAAVDFEGGTATALKFTAGLASRLRADVGLVHVVEPPYASSFLGTAMDKANFTGLLAGMLRRSDESLHKAAIEAGMDEAERIAVEGDRPADVILHEARKRDADLIVCASHNRGAIGRFFVGSTTERLVRMSELPVLVVPSIYKA
jgi:nucleotide-binding universal stress UspA family protein